MIGARQAYCQGRPETCRHRINQEYNHTTACQHGLRDEHLPISAMTLPNLFPTTPAAVMAPILPSLLDVVFSVFAVQEAAPDGRGVHIFFSRNVDSVDEHEMQKRGNTKVGIPSWLSQQSTKVPYLYK